MVEWSDGNRTRPMNNLSCMEAPAKWKKSKTLVYQGTCYRTFDTRTDWLADWSDYLVFSGLFKSVLEALDHDEQREEMVNAGMVLCYTGVLDFYRNTICTTSTPKETAS